MTERTTIDPMTLQEAVQILSSAVEHSPAARAALVRLTTELDEHEREIEDLNEALWRDDDLR